MPRPRISNLQVTGSNPVGRASFNKKHHLVWCFLLKRVFNTGIRILGSNHRRKGAHKAAAHMGIYNPVGRVRNSSHCSGGLIFYWKSFLMRGC